MWKLYPRLDVLRLDEPVIDATLRRDGSVNLARLVPLDDGSPMPQVWIGAFGVGGGTVNVSDQRGAAPREKALTPLTFELRDFATTTDAGGGFKLDAKSREGEGFHWDGKLSLAPLASVGRFRIDALQLALLARFAGDLLPATVSSGVLSLAGDYRFAVPPAAKGAKAPPMQFEAGLSALSVAGLAVRSNSGPGLAIESLALAPTHYALGSQSAAIGAVDIAGIKVTGLGKAGEAITLDSASLAASTIDLKAMQAKLGAVSLRGLSAGKGVTLGSASIAPTGIDMKMHAMRSIGQIAADVLDSHLFVAADNSVRIPGLYPLALPKTAPAAGPSWTWSLAGFALTGSSAQVTLERSRPATQIRLSPLRVSLGSIDSRKKDALPLDLAATVNGKATLAARGCVTPATGAMTLALDVQKLPVTDYLALGPALPFDIKSGLVSLQGKLDVTPSKAGPQPAFAGDVTVAALNIAERAGGNDLVSWDRMTMAGIRYRTAPAALAIETISFERPVSHVTISRNAEINLMTVAGGEAVPVAETGKLEVSAPISGALNSAGKLKVNAPISSALNAAGKIKVKPRAASAVATPATLPIDIRQMRFAHGSIVFADHSVQPDFAAKIEGFSGTITNLSTRAGSQAKIDLKGYVTDRFSPVTVTGRANPFRYDADTDITAKFSNIELPVFNPYSGTYAGYAIARGKLSTELHYRIVERKLEAGHHIVIDQLQWGAATESTRKVSLPVRLASSLLKDRHGVIDLDLPVSGTLDDPKFKIWPVVWKVVGNLLTKIITAPFALIGSLFEGGEKAQFVDFAPGSAAMPPDAAKSLGALAKGLADRPELNLDIPAGSGIREDAEAMTEAALHAAVAGVKKPKEGAPPFDYAGLEPEKKADRLRALYKAKFGKGPSFPKDGDVAKAGLLAGREAKESAAKTQITWLEAQLRPKFAPTDAELAELGQARAAAVEAALLDSSGLDPARVFISTASSVVAKDGKVEMELKVK